MLLRESINSCPGCTDLSALVDKGGMWLHNVDICVPGRNPSHPQLDCVLHSQFLKIRVACSANCIMPSLQLLFHLPAFWLKEKCGITNLSETTVLIVICNVTVQFWRHTAKHVMYVYCIIPTHSSNVAL